MTEREKKILKFILQARRLGVYYHITESTLVDCDYLSIKSTEDYKSLHYSIKKLEGLKFLTKVKPEHDTDEGIDLTDLGIMEAMKLSMPFYRRMIQNPWVIGAAFFALGVMVDKRAVVEKIKSLW